MSDIVTRPPAAEAAQTSLPSHRHSLVDLAAQLFEGRSCSKATGSFRSTAAVSYSASTAAGRPSTSTRCASFERLRDVVGDDDGCRAGGVGQLHNVAAQAGRRDLGERREALVEQYDARLDDEGTGDRDALTHPARQLCGEAVLGTGEVDREVDRELAQGIRTTCAA